MYNRLLALLTLLQIATRPISVLTACVIMIVQYGYLPWHAQQLGEHCQYMSDFVAGALVGKVIAYIAGRSFEKIRGVANARAA